MSSGDIASATISIGTGDYDGAIEILQKENPNRPKVLSMLGTAYFFKGRIWETYETYHKLYHNKDVYVYEMGCPIEEYDPQARVILDCMEKAQIPAICQMLKANSELEYNVKQSPYSEEKEFPEDEEFMELASRAFELGNDRYEEAMPYLKEFVFARRDLGGMHNEAMACYFEGCVCQRNEMNVEAFNSYLRAAVIEPEKAIYYARAGEIAFDNALKKDPYDIFVATLMHQRAIDLDYDNPLWHYYCASDLTVLAQMFGSEGKPLHQFSISAKRELQTAQNLCTGEHTKLYEQCRNALLTVN